MTVAVSNQDIPVKSYSLSGAYSLIGTAEQTSTIYRDVL